MSLEPDIADLMPACISDVILPRAHDISGFEVRRALPALQRQMVGTFIFFDQIHLDEASEDVIKDVRERASSTYGFASSRPCGTAPARAICLGCSPAASSSTSASSWVA